MLVVKGIRVTYDMARDVGERVLSVEVRCTECNIPRWVPLENEKSYRIAIPAYALNGGDGFTVLKENARNRVAGKIRCFCGL